LLLAADTAHFCKKHETDVDCACSATTSMLIVARKSAETNLILLLTAKIHYYRNAE